MSRRKGDPATGAAQPSHSTDVERRRLAAELMRQQLRAGVQERKARARVEKAVRRAHPVAHERMSVREKVGGIIGAAGVLAGIVVTVADGLLNGLFVFVPAIIIGGLLATTADDLAASKAIEDGIDQAVREQSSAVGSDLGPVTPRPRQPETRVVRLDQFDPGPLRVVVPSDGLRTEWRTAEEIAAAALRQLGVHDAVVTQSTRDGGVDVTSSTHVAQVKHLNKKVPAEVVQKIIGAALHRGAYAVVFSLGGYSQDALNYAEDMRVPLFTYDLSGTYTPANDDALLMVYDARHPDPDGP